MTPYNEIPQKYLNSMNFDENTYPVSNILKNVLSKVSERNNALLQKHKLRLSDCAKKYQLNEILNGMVVAKFNADLAQVYIGTYSSQKESRRLYPIKTSGIGRAYLKYVQNLAIEYSNYKYDPYILIKESDAITALTNEEFTTLLYYAGVTQKDMRVYMGETERALNRFFKDDGV